MANTADNSNNNAKGLMAALLAFLIWGLFPLYFKALEDYHAIEIIAHRIIWTFLLLAVVLMTGKRVAWLSQIRQNPKWLFLTLVSALLIATNWLVYVWAVNHDKVLEASLGYFINPLMGVLLSLIIFKERLRGLQKIAVALAMIAVIFQISVVGLSWVSLLLPLSFAFYGVLQRKTPFDAIDGLFIETALLLPMALIWLMNADVKSSHLSLWLSSEIWLLSLSGIVTLIPLWLYNKSTKLINFNSLSFLGYISPSLVFLLAVFYYHEAFDIKNLIVFGLIWMGLLVFSVDTLKYRKR